MLTSENQEYQLTLGGGIAWLDSTCADRYGKAYLECAAAQQKEVLDQIAYRENARKDPALGPGVRFFSLLRDLTTDGFFTSEIGIKYLEYIGNDYLAEFPGCRRCRCRGAACRTLCISVIRPTHEVTASRNPTSSLASAFSLYHLPFTI